MTEQAGFLATRFEVYLDGKTAYERRKWTSAKVQNLSFAERILWKRRRAEDVHVGRWRVFGRRCNPGDVIVGTGMAGGSQERFGGRLESERSNCAPPLATDRRAQTERLRMNVFEASRRT